MLINLTNHPWEKWDEAQKEQAKKYYGEVIDIPFPNIPPTASAYEVEELANKYFEKIVPYAFDNLDAVHIQGEFTFTFRLVNILLSNNIKCIASTTERIMTENPDGTRTYKFRFVRFREYI